MCPFIGQLYTSVGESILNPFKFTVTSKPTVTSIALLLDSHFSIPRAWLILSSELAGYQVLCWVYLLFLSLWSSHWRSMFSLVKFTAFPHISVRTALLADFLLACPPLCISCQQMLSALSGEGVCWGNGGAMLWEDWDSRQLGGSFSWPFLHLLEFLVPNVVAGDSTGWHP